MHDKSQKENDEKGKESMEQNSEVMQKRDVMSEKKESSMTNESKTVDDLTFNCNFCEREFQSARGLGVHLRRMHNASQEENTERGETKKRDLTTLNQNSVRKEDEKSENESQQKISRKIPDGKEKVRTMEKEKVPDKAERRIPSLLPLIEKSPNEEKEKDIELETITKNRKLLRWNDEDTERLIEKEIELIDQHFKGFVNVELAKKLGNKFTNLEVKARRQYIGYKRLLEGRMERYKNEKETKERERYEKEKFENEIERKRMEEKERELKRVKEREREKAKEVEWHRKRMAEKEKESERIERELSAKRDKEEHEKEEERLREKSEKEKKGILRKIGEETERDKDVKEKECEETRMDETITISEGMDESWHTAEIEVKTEQIDVSDRILSVPILMNPEKEIEEMYDRISRKCTREERKESSQIPKVDYKLKIMQGGGGMEEVRDHSRWWESIKDSRGSVTKRAQTRKSKGSLGQQLSHSEGRGLVKLCSSVANQTWLGGWLDLRSNYSG
ncbi:hypothetical protein SNEBB_006332 [Seison nebaliae]|nr:hypothetical protein SNEBB_006332 [Seison nebaliae]